MKKLFGFLVILLCSLASLSAYGINKCTDASGKVSFQDKPCETSAASETVLLQRNRDSDNTDNLEPVYVKIPGVGDGVLFSYIWWTTNISQQNAKAPPTVKMVSKQGEEPISFSITFIPNKTNKKISLKESADSVVQMASRYVDGSVENEINLRQLDTTIGPAIYASFTDERYLNTPIPNGEFSTITVGQVAHSKLVVGFTILTNGTQSKALSEAFNIIGSFQVVASK